MSTIQSGIEFIGINRSLTRSLDDSVRAVRSAAQRINSTKASFNIKFDTAELNKKLAEAKKAINGANAIKPQIDTNDAQIALRRILGIYDAIKKHIESRPIRMMVQTIASGGGAGGSVGVPALLAGSGAGGAGGTAAPVVAAGGGGGAVAAASRGKSAGGLLGPNSMLSKIAASSGADPFINALAKIGPKAVAALVALKLLQGALDYVAIKMDAAAAAARGDIAGEASAEKALNAWKASVPVVGELAASIHSVFSEDVRYIKNLEYETELQEKLIAKGQERVKRQRELTEESERNIKAIEREAEDRNASPAQRAVLDAERKLDDRIAEQDKERGERALLPEQQAERDALGRETARARARRAAAERNAKVRDYAQDQQRKAEEQAETDERRKTREREIRAMQGRRARRGLEAQADASREAEAVRSGEARTRIEELRGSGKRGQAEVEAIAEEYRQAVASAGGNKELIGQAGRTAAARLGGLDRELSGRLARAEVIGDAGFKSLRGGTNTPADETPKVLKDIIARKLDDIVTNTRNLGGML